MIDYQTIPPELIHTDAHPLPPVFEVIGDGWRVNVPPYVIDTYLGETSLLVPGIYLYTEDTWEEILNVSQLVQALQDAQEALAKYLAHAEQDA